MRLVSLGLAARAAEASAPAVTTGTHITVDLPSEYDLAQGTG